MVYEDTHTSILMVGNTEHYRAACRAVFGENDIMQPLYERAWFTLGNALYLRRNLADSPAMTFFMLKNRYDLIS